MRQRRRSLKIGFDETEFGWGRNRQLQISPRQKLAPRAAAWRGGRTGWAGGGTNVGPPYSLSARFLMKSAPSRRYRASFAGSIPWFMHETGRGPPRSQPCGGQRKGIGDNVDRAGQLERPTGSAKFPVRERGGRGGGSARWFRAERICVAGFLSKFKPRTSSALGVLPSGMNCQPRRVSASSSMPPGDRVATCDPQPSVLGTRRHYNRPARLPSVSAGVHSRARCPCVLHSPTIRRHRARPGARLEQRKLGQCEPAQP